MNHSRRLAYGLGLVAAASLCLLSACSSSDNTSPPVVETGGSGGTAATGGNGGSGAVAGGGAGGSGGTVVPPKQVEKIDLLLMIDNSASMADKQQILADAVPDLVNRLVNPACVDTNGNAVQPQPAKPLDACPAGSTREFTPVFDIHVGVISSSLGGHGADSCSNIPTSQYNPRMEDMSHLIARSPNDPSTTLPTYQNKGFLYWDPTKQATPPGESDIPAFVAAFSQIVNGAGQDGCGFEAPLEAWYRFLVDPAPYQQIVPFDCNTNQPASDGQCRGPDGVDTTVLAQRKDFVRPDSLVAIVMLTDEDDCSLMDGGQNYIALQAYSGMNPWHLPRATSICKTNPKSAQCVSCAQGDFSSDPECAKGMFYGDQEDSLNLRCIHQKQRFGIDFLYPTKRYVQGLTQATLADGRVNPLFCSVPSSDGKSCTTSLRDPSQILLAGIVGVPWQDIAKDPNDLSKGYKPADQLPWDVIAGDLDNYVDPKDPLMIQSTDPRSGTNPITNEALAPPTSGPNTNKSNSHEWSVLYQNDLQYACVFKLPTPKDCSANTTSCDCAEADGLNNPLCQSDSGQYGKTQYRAKGYPAPRILTVLKGMGSRAAVGSICAGNTTDSSVGDYGYRPAIAALVARMKPSL